MDDDEMLLDYVDPFVVGQADNDHQINLVTLDASTSSDAHTTNVSQESVNQLQVEVMMRPPVIK